ncbi:MAG: DoxX family protein [Chitinophagales bacterium]
MKKLMSIKYSPLGFDIATLLLRVAAGVMMIPHGYGKLVKFAEMKDKFMDFMGIGPVASLALVIFAEFFCSILLTAGLFTRLALIPLTIAMAVALFQAHSADLFGDGQTAALYLSVYIALLILGPGKFSVDGAIK